MSIKYNGKLIAGKYKTQVVTDATESNKGLIRIATQEEINTGTDNTTAVTPKDLATKQNVIPDLDTIRQGANKGSTALQSIPDEYVTETELNAKGYLTQSTLPVGSNMQEGVVQVDGTTITAEDGIISAVQQDLTPYLTKNEAMTTYETVENAMSVQEELQSSIDTKQDIISDLDTIRAGATLGATALQSIPDEYVTETELNAKGYLTSYTETDPIYTADKPNIANTSLDNLSATGEKHFLNKSQITNCLLEVPQRIKLELNDGVLTLKAGSQVIIPNGFEADGTTPKFDYVDIESDIAINSVSADSECTLYYNQTEDGLSFYYTYANSSGTTPPMGDGTFYNTANNIINRYTNGSVVNQLSLPLATITDGTSTITSIDQVFNGIGYIGSTVWVDKGVKGLIPNGRNADGSLKNIEFETSRVLTHTNTYDLNSVHWVICNGSKIEEWDSVSWIGYNEEKNIIYNKNGSASSKDGNQITYSVIAYMNHDGTERIASFQPKQPFRAVDWSEVDGKVSKSGDTMSGRLHFNESPVVHDFISNTNCYVQRTNRILSNADPVDSNIYVSGISIVDETNYEIAKTEIAKYSDGTIRHNFLAHNINGVGTGWTAIGVGYKLNGTPITYAPTPPTSDNSSQIATTAWVKALPRLIETWESEWFTSPGASKSVSFNLAGTGMNATNAPRIFIEMIGKVVTVDSGYAVGDIIYPQFANYNGSTGGREEGQSVFFRDNTLTYAQGNSTSWVGTKATGGQDGVNTASIQIKIILRRFSN